MNREGASPTDPTVRIAPNDILRFLLELFAFVTFALWGFSAWDLPLNLVFGVGAPLLAALIWGLFVSPRAVLALDVYGRSLIELLVMGAAAVAWLDLGQPIVAIVFGVLAVVSGVVAGRRSLS
ncbi:MULTISPECIES: YrdB family protein [unclassified Rathayibacter]|uniref:YrdB family protein n=1 Tax=unclassified Rathayibacter TaxID=2609250 RepID=UPI002B26607C|nr:MULTISPECIES: YrdB family protein [unclassified Rathayibacter]